jgi:hypothetical protein
VKICRVAQERPHHRTSVRGGEPRSRGTKVLPPYSLLWRGERAVGSRDIFDATPPRGLPQDEMSAQSRLPTPESIPPRRLQIVCGSVSCASLGAEMASFVQRTTCGQRDIIEWPNTRTCAADVVSRNREPPQRAREEESHREPSGGDLLTVRALSCAPASQCRATFARRKRRNIATRRHMCEGPGGIAHRGPALSSAALS